MYKIAICDDSQDMTNLVHKLTQKWATARDLTTEINIFDSSEAFLFSYSKSRDYDILLLDIEMGGMDGGQSRKEAPYRPRRRGLHCQENLGRI